MVFTVLVLFTFMVNAQHTYLEIPVENWWDDGEEVVLPNDQGELLGELDVGSSDLEMPFDHSGQIVGLLFRNVEIEPGQHIVSAYIQFTSDDDAMDLYCKILIQAELAVQPDTIDDTELFNLSKRTMTDTVVTWEPDPWIAEFDAGIAQSTPDLKPILDELTSQDGWVSGNRMLIFCHNPDNPFGEDTIRKAVSCDPEHDYAPVLHVELAPVSVENLSSEFVSLVYPNPTEGKLHIQNPSTGRFSYTIIDVTGRLVGSRSDIAASETEVDLSDLAKGSYFVNITSLGKTETFKVVYK